MRRLLLLRHAKSDWNDAGLDDHDRPLAARGEAAAPRMAVHMREQGNVPELVLCSSATRTRQTAKLVVAEFPARPKIHYARALYLADWPVLLAAIRKAPPAMHTLLVVGHNPGMQQLAIALALQPKTSGERARAELLAEKFPTAGLAVLEFDTADWSSVAPGAGRLAAFVRPKDLHPAKVDEA